MSVEDLHKYRDRLRMRGCAMLAALGLLLALASCWLGGIAVRSGAIDPIATSQGVGPVQVISFVLCRSPALIDPCVSGRRTYEVWLVVDWDLLDAGDPRSYLLLDMALD